MGPAVTRWSGGGGVPKATALEKHASVDLLINLLMDCTALDEKGQLQTALPSLKPQMNQHLSALDNTKRNGRRRT
jgi:hypothetical protein